MTEDDYILATDLRALTIAQSVLSNVIPANNKHVDGNAYKTIMRTLDAWTQAMYGAVEAQYDAADRARDQE